MRLTGGPADAKIVINLIYRSFPLSATPEYKRSKREDHRLHCCHFFFTFSWTALILKHIYRVTTASGINVPGAFVTLFILHRAILVSLDMRYARKVKLAFIVSTISR